MKSFHRSARAIHTVQFAVAIEDENAVGHRIERRFPFGLSARHHLEQFGLRDADGDSFGQRFYECNFILSPHAYAISLVNAKRTAKFSLDKNRIVDLRAHTEVL